MFLIELTDFKLKNRKMMLKNIVISILFFIKSNSYLLSIIKYIKKGKVRILKDEVSELILFLMGGKEGERLSLYDKNISPNKGDENAFLLFSCCSLVLDKNISSNKGD